MKQLSPSPRSHAGRKTSRPVLLHQRHQAGAGVLHLEIAGAARNSCPDSARSRGTTRPSFHTTPERETGEPRAVLAGDIHGADPRLAGVPASRTRRPCCQNSGSLPGWRPPTKPVVIMTANSAIQTAMCAKLACRGRPGQLAGTVLPAAAPARSSGWTSRLSGGTHSSLS